MGGRWREAFRAGLITLLLGFLCAATLAAPALASEPDFAHTHPHGTPPHLHALEPLLGGVVSAPVVAARPAQRISRTAYLPELPRIFVAAPRQHRSRAPPA